MKIIINVLGVFAIFTGCIAAAESLGEAKPAEGRPNRVILYADDMGSGDLDGFAENTIVIFTADNGAERYAYEAIRAKGQMR